MIYHIAKEFSGKMCISH